MLKGALAEWRVGYPWLPESDMGPLIDEDAARQIRRHIEHLSQTEQLLAKAPASGLEQLGHYIEPHVFKISRLTQLTREVFGPVLHVITYKVSELEQVLQDINNTGYGLTLGVHSRIDGFAQQVFANTRVGNTYVNRNIVGAVVGVNPFGGQGLSGTGPKAGGPNYLQRFAVERTYTDNIVAKGGNTDLFTMADD
jgi:RHH-type proline utilization regulon transcriptional repressor/proline dehydrogenase/delta 1-pyrroline-5-carboxylate dehydrogenase